MNVFHRFTRASLRKNPSRTLVTVVGIMLSMALVTAVIQGACSGVRFLVRSEEERVGAFHGYYYNLTAEEAEQARQAANVKDSAAWRTVGWAEIDSRNEYKPYLLIRSVSDNFTDLVKVHLTAGRMPERADEILLPGHLATDGGVTCQVGDTVTLTVGRRIMDGYELDESNPFEPLVKEEIAGGVSRTYTVTGIYQRFDLLLEDYSCPGYTALTGWDDGAEGTESVFFTVKNVRHFYDGMDEYAVSENWRAHSDLLRMSGVVRSENIARVIYSFAAILIFLIAFGSISLIYNSFAISVSERTRQFGILKSVGATKKQIRGSILYEALLLGGAGIVTGAAVGCLGIGITLWALRDAFSAFSLGTGVQMKLVVSPAGLIVAAAVCLATTLISAWIPARRADRVSAIEAIRQTRDVKIRGRDVRVSPLTGKLFGFEGMMAAKNFKRNRKSYRATVVSLFLSVTLFIAASSFCAYLTDLVGGVTAGDSRSDITYYTVGEDRPDPDDLLARFTAVPGVTGGCYADVMWTSVRIALDDVAGEYWKNMEVDPEAWRQEGALTEMLGVAFVDEAAFRALCAESGLRAEDYLNADAPGALLYNRRVDTTYDEKGNGHWVETKVLDESRLPTTVRIVRNRGFDGYELMEVEEDTFYYYPLDYVSDYYQRHAEADWVELDRSYAMAKTRDEVEISTELETVAVVKNTVPILPENQPALIYPYGARDAVLADGGVTIQETYFALTAPDHAGACETIRQQLEADGADTSRLFDQAGYKESQRMIVTVVRVFSYGFIILISLIAMANVFNTVSTNVMLRRREFAMLKSIGLGEKGFRRMMDYECVIYGCKGLLWGLPAAAALTYLIYRVTGGMMQRGFYIPWYSVAIAVGSVFAVVFATMLYATGVIRRDNPIDALRQENL